MESYQAHAETEMVVIDSIPVATAMNDAYKQAQAMLLDAKMHLQHNNWEDAANACREFLTLLRFQRHSQDDNHHNYFKQVAMKMIAHHHHFDAVLTLEEVYDHMVDFTGSFFRTVMKKGVDAPKPLFTRGDAYFIYSFCTGFFSMLVSLETE